MKYLCYLTIMLLLIVSCAKTSRNEPVTPPATAISYTASPALTPVKTSIIIYTSNSQYTNPLYVQTGGAYFDYLKPIDGFTISNIVTDKYSTVIGINPQLSYNYGGSNMFKVFSVTDGVRSYADMRILELTGTGSFVHDDGSGTFEMPGGGQIIIPPYGLGVYPGAVSFGVAAGYLHPAINDYAVSLPCYAMSDDKGKRWFLNSFGMYYLVPQIGSVADAAIDFNPSVQVIIKLPITTKQQATAPDSIEVWNINSSRVWEKNGYAHKVNGQYEKQVTRRGSWNFATPIEGVYITVHLRTANGSTITNTRIKLKNDGDEVADARTDANGDALVFVPSHKNITIDVINDHHYAWANIQLVNQLLGSFATAGEKTFVVPARIDLTTIEGNAYNCDGSILMDGAAVILSRSAKEDQGFAIVNGKFKGSIWINSDINFEDMNILDSKGTILSGNKMILGTQLINPFEQNVRHYNLNDYGCADASELYCKYRIDTTNYIIAAHDAGAANPVLTKAGSNISIDDNGKGISLDGYFGWVLGNGYLNNTIKINGIVYIIEGDSEITITRIDTGIGGYVEGWFQAFYRDKATVPHYITGNFRVKKLS